MTLYEHSPVQTLMRKDNLWQAHTPKGRVTAPKVILGVNGHIQDFGFYRGRLMHVFTYTSMTRAFRDSDITPAATGQESWALLPADPMGATLRKITTDDGTSRLVIRTRFTCDPSLRVSAQRVEHIAARQRHSLDARFPALKDLPFEQSWAGRICLSLNSVPAFGEADHNLYPAC